MPENQRAIDAAVTSAALSALLAARYLAHYHLSGTSSDPFAELARDKFLSALNRLIADVRRVGPLAAVDSFTPLERNTQ